MERSHQFGRQAIVVLTVGKFFTPRPAANDFVAAVGASVINKILTKSTDKIVEPRRNPTMADNGEQELNRQPSHQPQGGPVGGGGFTLSGKTLGIAGGGAAALVVVIVVVVLLVTGVFGGGGGGGASGGSDILAYVPGDAGMVGIGDNNAFLNGDVPEDYVEWMEEDSEDSGDSGISSETYKALDIKDDDVALSAIVADQNLNRTLEIVQGDFEYDVIREELEDGLDCEEDDYRGFELWECPGQKPPAVALFEKDGYVVMAIERAG